VEAQIDRSWRYEVTFKTKNRPKAAARRRLLNSNLMIMDDKASAPLFAIIGLQEPGYSYAQEPPRSDFPAEPFLIHAVHETPLLLDRRRSFRRP
jgi:hypothetical protein